MEAQALQSNQLLATRLFIPSSPHTIIERPRLFRLLQEGLAYRLILVSAPPGFGKTTLLSSWVRSLPEDKYRVAWVSLDAEDNNWLRCWTYVLTALNNQLQ